MTRSRHRHAELREKRIRLVEVLRYYCQAPDDDSFREYIRSQGIRKLSVILDTSESHLRTVLCEAGYYHMKPCVALRGPRQLLEQEAWNRGTVSGWQEWMRRNPWYHYDLTQGYIDKMLPWNQDQVGSCVNLWCSVIQMAQESPYDETAKAFLASNFVKELVLECQHRVRHARNG